MNSKILKYNTDVVSKLEKGFKVEYPILDNATYKTLVNYATDLNSPIQKWYRYKEGYSLKLIDQLFQEYSVKPNDVIIDPFCGSGSTLVQAKINKSLGVGFEINPFSTFLAKVKTRNYNQSDLNQFAKISKKIIKIKPKDNLKKPELSIIDKLFSKKVLDFLLTLKLEINKISNKKVRDLLFLAYLGMLEEVSNHRKAGNGLKMRKTIKTINRDITFAKELFLKSISEIEKDLPFAINISNTKLEPKIIEHSSLNMNKYVKPNSVKGVIFSPPYANCFDYTEIYKVELWMGDFVKKYSELKELRHRSIRSHLNGYVVEQDSKASSLPELNELIEILGNLPLWDKRIPKMINGYFTDMFTVLDQIYASLKKGGFCTIIVSNSAYGGVVVPTDLLLTKYAQQIGFKPLKIDVARFIITSSQQYRQTEKYKKYLRESIIHLKK